MRKVTENVFKKYLMTGELFGFEFEVKIPNLSPVQVNIIIAKIDELLASSEGQLDKDDIDELMDFLEQENVAEADKNLPHFSRKAAFQIVYVLQEGCYCVDDNIEMCSNSKCETIFDAFRSHYLSGDESVDGRIYCEDCYEEFEDCDDYFLYKYHE